MNIIGELEFLLSWMKKAHLYRQQGQSLKVWELTSTHPPILPLKSKGHIIKWCREFFLQIAIFVESEGIFEALKFAITPPISSDPLANSSNQLYIQYSIYFWANLPIFVSISHKREHSTLRTIMKILSLAPLLFFKTIKLSDYDRLSHILIMRTAPHA